MNKWKYIVLALVIGLGLWVRFSDLHSDPPADLSGSAGAYFDGFDNAHSARSYTLFGDLRPDEWDPILYAPPFVFLQVLWFKLFEPSMWSVNAFSAFFSTLSFLVGIFLFRRFGFKGLLMSSILLGFTYPWVHFSRVAMFENIMIFFMALSMFCLGWSRLTPWRAAGVGFFAILAYASKATAIYFLPTAGFAVLLACWQGYFIQKEWKLGLAILGSYVSGSLASLIPWLVLFRIPDAEKISFYGKQWYTLALPSTFHEAVMNFLEFKTFLYAAKFDYLFLLGFVIACVVVLLVLFRPSKVPPLVLLWSFWLGGCILVASILNYSPPRYIVPAFLPAFCLVCYAITRWDFSRPKLVTAQWIVLALLCVHFLDENGEKMRYAIRHPHYSIEEFNKTLVKTLPEGSIVAGISALFATIDTDFTALRIDPRGAGWFNGADPFKKFGVTHMMVTPYGGNDIMMFQNYRADLSNAKKILEYQVCRFAFYVYEVNPAATDAPDS